MLEDHAARRAPERVAVHVQQQHAARRDRAAAPDRRTRDSRLATVDSISAACSSCSARRNPVLTRGFSIQKALKLNFVPPFIVGNFIAPDRAAGRIASTYLPGVTKARSISGATLLN